jgi:hypothetical protein
MNSEKAVTPVNPLRRASIGVQKSLDLLLSLDSGFCRNDEN